MLIDVQAHHEGVIGYVLIALLLIVGPLAALYGADSRIDTRARRDRYSG